MVDIKLYTVAQLKYWLMHNKPTEGLSEQVIAPTRAWAISHNPYVRDDDAIVAAIFENGQLAAYTASFPDMLDGKRVWWASTLYCYPQFAGRGYGMIVVGSLMEAHEPDLTYDRWGAQETVEIFNHFDYQTIYTKRYHLTDKRIKTGSLKGKLAYGIQELKKCLHPWPKPSKANYTLRYASYIDGETYAFMQKHKGYDLWLREQDMMNWILRYPFAQGCIILNRLEKNNTFSSYVDSSDYKVVKIYEKECLIGLFILRERGNTIAIAYLYYKEEYKDIVFISILDHIIALKPKEVVTENKSLLVYIKQRLYFPKIEKERISLSLPVNQKVPSNSTLQLGDGDSFA